MRLVTSVFLAAIALACSDASNSGVVLAQPPSSAEVFGEVRPFELVERSGRPVTRDSLLGRPWVASFIFTRCTGPCPRIASNVRALQAKLKGVDARIVTISVDPSHDTPEVLRAYADKLEADPDRWWFLTGGESAVRDLATKSFMTALARDSGADVGESVTHTTFLAVVDARGAIRGFYEGETLEGVEQAAERARWLAAHP